MPVGVFFDGFSSTAEMLEVCREAEEAGASSLWFAQHMGYRDAHDLGDRGRGRDPQRDARSGRDQSLSLAAAAGRHVDCDPRRVRARTA